MAELPEKIGRYEVESIAGRGAMGVVYKAVDPLIHRSVAVKMVSLPAVLSEDQRREFNERFFREAQAAGNLHHPNIVTIFDVGEEDGVPYMAQEFVEGKSLSKVMAEAGGPLPLEQALGILRQMADALQYAHGEGVVHRDIKPDNILVEEGGRAVLTDFGVARLASSDLTRTGEVLGTPHFMSPEQVLGQAVDGRSDLFSLGVVLYLMAAGHKPFTGETVTSVCYQIVHGEPRPVPGELEIPPEVRGILSRLIAKSREDRFNSGAELIRALDETLDRTVAMESTSEPSGRVPVEAAAARGGKSAAGKTRRLPSKGDSTAGKRPGGAKAFLIVLGVAGILAVGLLSFLAVGKLAASLRSKEAPSSEVLAEETPGVAGGEGGDLTTAGPPETVPERRTVRRAPKSKPKPVSSPARAQAPAPRETAGEKAGAIPEAEPEKPAVVKVAKAHVGLIVEGPFKRGVFKVYANGKRVLDAPFIGMSDSRRLRKTGFRLVKTMSVEPGSYTVRFELIAKVPRSYYATASKDITLVPGETLTLKLEPRRFPARLKIKTISRETPPPATGDPAGTKGGER